MADSLQLEVATPERELVREEVTEVQSQARRRGTWGFWPGHARL
jgi:F0F1-type ATP synthase epsilon subunit